MTSTTNQHNDTNTPFMALDRLLNDALASRDGYGNSREDAKIIEEFLLSHAYPILDERLQKSIDYSIDLQRIIESLCDGRDIVKPKTTAVHHYDMAMAYRSAMTQLTKTQENVSCADLLSEAVKVIEFYAEPSLMSMDGHWYEYADSNVDITQYAPVGKRARAYLKLQEVVV